MMINILTALFAYIIDAVFGEFKFIKHPIIYIGDIIKFFESRYYKDSIFRGFLLVVFVISITFTISFAIYLYLSELNDTLNIIISSFIASIFLAHNMLHSEVTKILTAKDKKKAISMLVSRDTKDMTQSDIYKASIETYAENLSDGVIAPLFYLLLFNLPGVVVYKTVNTLDSMVGYRDKRYEKFGKLSARLDDVLNYIPSRITAVLIMFLFKQKDIFRFYNMGKKHLSPNAGHPISAMALCVGVTLGGDTSYFGKIVKKAKFGDGKKTVIESYDLKKSLSIKKKLDRFILSNFLLFAMLYKSII